MNDRFTCRPTTGTTTTSRQRNVLALSARVAELERQAAQLTAERDEWAHKAQDWRHKYAELRYPGMTREVKALDAAIDAAMKETK